MGGKRKSAKRVVVKRKATVAKVFSPPSIAYADVIFLFYLTEPRGKIKRVLACSQLQVFKCPFCSHDASCEVKLDRSVDTGSISCRVCGENYQMRINHLTEPVDVFCEWVDACETARKSAAPLLLDADATLF